MTQDVSTPQPRTPRTFSASDADIARADKIARALRRNRSDLIRLLIAEKYTELFRSAEHDQTAA